MSKRKTDSAMLNEIAISIAGYGCPRASTKIREIARRVARDAKRLDWLDTHPESVKYLRVQNGWVATEEAWVTDQQAPIRSAIDAAMKRERKEKR